MKRLKSIGFRLMALPVGLVLMGAACPGPDGNNNNNNNNNSNDNIGRLFVVNNTISVSSFAANDDGDVAPLTELPAGATTDLFQPRAVMVTKDLVLLVGRQNGGITAHDDALNTTGDVLADRVVEGTDSQLDSPIAFAYDSANDTLYVGNINAAQGILVFENVSETTFDGDIQPDRTFNPADRAPTNTTEMGIDALWLDSDGVLYVADTSGLNTNSSRILIYENPSAASGETEADTVLTSAAWSVVEDMAVDTQGNLYIVDGDETIVRIDNAKSKTGVVLADETLTIPGSLIDLSGIVISTENVCYVADTSNDEIHSIVDIDTLTTGTVTPATTISGNNTGLFAPRQLWLVENVD